MPAKKVLGWLALAFVLLWIIIAPSGAAAFAEDIGHAIMAAVNNLITFFESLSN